MKWLITKYSIDGISFQVLTPAKAIELKTHRMVREWSI